MPYTMHHTAGQTATSRPMVGRAAERVLLSEQLSSVFAGHGNAVIIGGEAGIGKTTIARDLARQALERGAIILSGHCHDLMAAPPYGIWLDLVEGYQQLSEQAALPPLPEVLASRRLERISTQLALFEEVAAFFSSLAALRPLVIVLEDVHWADPASLALLRFISARIAHQAMLVVVTYRIDELTRQNPFYQQLPALVRESEGLRIDLKRLATPELESLVSLHYSLNRDDRHRLVDHLVTYAEGNPFFTLELLRSLEDQEDGGLQRTDQGWQLGDIDHLHVPSLVRQVIDARVARLGEAVRDPLTIASVIGHDVPIELLAAIAGADADSLFAAIDTAIEWHLCAESADGTRINFVHALTREALYTSIPPHRRRALHRQVAEYLEERTDIPADTIAYHYQHALDPRAPTWLTRAGDRAQRAYAWLTARDRFAAAADLLHGVPGEEQTRARLLYRCGRLQRYSHATDAIDSLRTASRLAEQAGDLVLAADATYSQGLVQCFADDWASGLSNIVGGVEMLRDLPAQMRYIPWSTASWMADALPTVAMQASTDDDATGERLVAIDANRHMSLAWFLADGGRIREALDVTETYKDVVPGMEIGPLSIANTGHAAFGLGIARAAMGEQESASEAFQHARQAYLQIDHHACIAFTQVTELMDVMIPYRTDDVLGRRHLSDEAGQAIDRARGAFPTAITPAYALLPIMLLDGRWDDARAIVADGNQFGTYILRRLVTQALAPVAHHRGDTEDAWSHIHRLLPDGADAIPGTAVLLDALMLQQLAADISLEEGKADDAQAWLEANDRWLSWSGSVAGRAENALGWAKHAAMSGDTVTARAHAERAVAMASAPRQPIALIQAWRFRGYLALELGDTSSAERDLPASLALATTCEIPFERALSLEALAHLRAPAHPAEATRLAQATREIAQKLRANPTIDRVEAFLAGRASVPPEHGGDLTGLTPRERDVLRLVALGMTDAEVADQLSISPRTVGQHLRSVYGKLEVRSRTEATRLAMKHGFV